MNGNNGRVILELQGSKKDFVGAWIMRLLGTLLGAAILWTCKLIFAAVMYLVNTLPPMQADVNSLKTDVKSLKENAATKQELVDAEKRVKTEFSEQLKKGTTISGPNRR
jgi:hypothetical protein